jgi:hypothetical protein
VEIPGVGKAIGGASVKEKKWAPNWRGNRRKHLRIFPEVIWALGNFPVLREGKIREVWADREMAIGFQKTTLMPAGQIYPPSIRVDAGGNSGRSAAQRRSLKQVRISGTLPPLNC